MANNTVVVVYRDRHCMNERYLFIVTSGCFFACSRTVLLLQPGYYHLKFPPVKVSHIFFLALT